MVVDERANFEVKFFVLLRQKTSGFPTAIGARSVQFVSRGTLRPLSARGLYPMGPGPTAIGARSRAPTRRQRWLSQDFKVRSVFSRVPVLAEFKRRTSKEEKSTSVICLDRACLSSRFGEAPCRCRSCR